MSQLAREELAEILFQEIATYLPNIQRSITDLYMDGGNEETLYEVHRLFHNIKGAASQVSFLSLSRTAAICEAVSGALLERKDSRQAQIKPLDFLVASTQAIDAFCKDDNKTQLAEDALFAETAASFTTLFQGPDKTYQIDLPDSLRKCIEESTAAVAGGLPQPLAPVDPHTSEMREKCLVSFKSVIPLLSQFTGYLSKSDPRHLSLDTLYPLSEAVSTLADCALTAGLNGQYRLLADFHVIIQRLLEDASLLNPEMLGLLQEFVSYLDIVFSMEPEKGELAVTRVQSTLSGLVDSLFTGAENLRGADILQAEGFADDFLPEFFQDETGDAGQDDPLAFLDEADEEQPDALDLGGLPAEIENEFAADIPAPDEDLFMPASVEEPRERTEEDELLEIFQAECDEHLQAIGHELNMLESGVRGEIELTPELRNNVGSMRRAVHTLKGAAAMTGFDVLSGCAHSLEDMLDWLNDNAATISGDDVRVIAQAVDVIETLSANPGANAGDAGSVSTSIKQYLAGRTGEGGVVESAEEPQPVPAAEKPAVKPEAAEEPRIVAAEQDEDEQAGVAGNIRVKLGDLDELTAIEGELVVARGSLEKQLEKFSFTLENLGNVKESLQRKSQELEVGFEAQSLYGFGAAGKPLGPVAAEALSPANPEFDPIELDQYSQLNLIIRSLNEISSDMNALHTEMVGMFAGMRGQVAKQQLAMGVMQEKLLRIRMTPFSSITRLLFRTVRQTAAQLNKDVRLTITGEDVFMDRFVWSRTLDPLMHILRNCVDHGIEDDRPAAGKAETGQITIDALQRSRFVVLRISDDGRGVDVDRLRRKLVHDGLIKAADNISDEDLLPFLFRPSISTKQDISTISGRGVGLDVVVKNIKELRGTVQMFNRPGQGVTFELAIPITLSVNRAIVVSVGGRTFAIPLQDIVEVKKYRADEVQITPEPTIVWREKSLKVHALASLLSGTEDAAEQDAHVRLMLIVDNGTEHVALEADRVIEQREIVIKDLGSHLTYVRGISGVTLTGEGNVIPILNLVELAKEDLSGVTAVVAETSVERKKRANSVLVIDDSISVRHAITRLLESQSWAPTQAVDGVDALEKLETFTPDVIIVDIEMPRMNGYEFMSVLRSDEKRQAIPVIMLTSRASEKHRKKAFELGVQHYVTKPYQEEAFIDLLESIRPAQ